MEVRLLFVCFEDQGGGGGNYSLQLHEKICCIWKIEIYVTTIYIYILDETAFIDLTTILMN